MYKTACFSYNVKHGNGSEWALSTPFGMINYWCKNSFSYRQQKRQIEGLCEYIGWFEKDDKSGMSICGLFLTFRLVATQRRWTSTKKPSRERLWSSLIYYYHFSDCLKNSGCGEIELAVREARELEHTQFLPFFDCTNIRGKERKMDIRMENELKVYCLCVDLSLPIGSSPPPAMPSTRIV